MNKGKVYLVGSGPGDPRLLTCRAKQLLSETDVVCYDKLVSAAILALIPESVEMHEVGYRGYQGTHIDYGMHPEVIDFALAGKRVTRLKAGDPCIFGRTTEECLSLKELGISYEIIPGITAALGAASYSGFPLTSAGTASSVTFVSGHKNTHALDDWVTNSNKSGTLVLYMGARKLAEHTRHMIEKGVPPSLPIAVISSATSANHKCIIGTVESIAGRVDEQGYIGPALVIAGEVVSQAKALDWRQYLPMAGCKVLVCGNYQYADLLCEMGAEVISVDVARAKSTINEKTLMTLSEKLEIEFVDLSAFEAWWQALMMYKIDVRLFNKPLSSRDPKVHKVMSDVGLKCERPTRNAYSLATTFDGIEGEADLVIGYVELCLPRYELPEMSWVLVSDFNVYQAIKEQQPSAVGNSQFVSLNPEIHRKAQENQLICDHNEAPWFVRNETESLMCNQGDVHVI
ncbi:uroporphyrinogen-III C-methyltransferase [Vibrio sp. 10N.222.51.C12]|uniref:uroporphyrinogen-III C-methyltransferase n=1 Tax=unclassified Vibrio TaxID=2614977 RepID=UPI000C819E0E|nr:uroporphyrinogen-III C-methyltransferase [Vibrio sp. 10N.286.48.B7]PMH77707.1 uroporphyrinogen-III C-methyltransferase [Vibrio sp. 10N.286.48.B7]